MTPNAIYSKSGKGVQEASGKTSLLSRGDRAVLSAFDGRLSVSDVADRVGKPFDAKFQQLITLLEKEGYIREVSAGTAPVAKPSAPRPAAAAAKPAAAPAAAAGPDLDFTIAIPASPPPKPKIAPAPQVDSATKARAETEKKAQEDNMARARREAEEKQQKERDRVKTEAEAKIRAETEAKMRTEAEDKAKSDAAAKVRAETEARVKAVRETAVRLAAEAKAKAEAEMQAKLDAERAKIQAEAEKARREAEELRQRLDEERKAREAEERKRKEEDDRRRKEEEDRRRKEEEARRKEEEARRKEDEARRAREEAERKAREAEERRRREEEEKRRKDEDERRMREEVERQAREASERKRREEDGQRVREENERAVREMQEAEAERAAAERSARQAKEQEQEQEQAKEREESAAAAIAAATSSAPAAAPASDGGFGDLMADLDSFSNRDAAEKKAKEDAERKEKDEKKARQASEEAERKAKEEAELGRKLAEEAAEKEERRRKEEEAKRKKEEDAERAKQEAEDRKRREREAEMLAVRAAAASKSDDIGVSDDDLDMEDVKADQEAVSKESRKAQREREREAKEREREAKERAKEREREAKRAAKAGSAAAPAAYKPLRRRRHWGRSIAITLFVLLAAGVGALHVMPISTAEYEKAASDAIGRPVKIAEAHVSLVSGVELKLDGVSVGATKIASVRAFPEIGSLLDDRKAFSRIELDGVTVEQQALGEVLAATLRGRNFSVGRLNVKRLKLDGPLPLPVLEADVLVGSTGAIGVISVQGPDSLAGKFTPTATGIDFDVTASGFTLPFMPDVTLSTFAMKGRATRDSARIESWGGAYLDGAFSGSANLRWGPSWTLDGVLTGRGVNAAVFAPALLSEGKAEGTARFSMSDADPTKFRSKGRVEGTFSLNKGVLGSFDLSRAIQTGGRQATGRTPFTEMSGQAVFDRGAVALRNVNFGAGALNAAASADISPEGALSGRIIADIRTSSQNLRATVNIGGTVTEPLVK